MYTDHQNFKLTIADNNDLDEEEYTICDKIVKPTTTSKEQTLYTQVAHFSCERDLPQLKVKQTLQLMN